MSLRKIWSALVVAATLFASGNATAQITQTRPLPPHTEEFATMRDGVKLAANVFLPEGKGPWPVVVERTPYGKDGGIQELVGGSERYTSRGIAFVMQDTRGKGNSQGSYSIFKDDIADGYDTIEWAAKQPWSNGKVGITGPSAMGITTNLAAIAAPPHLIAGYALVAPRDRGEFNYPGGVLKEQDSVGWSKGQNAPAAQIQDVYDSVVENLLDRRSEMTQGLSFVRIPMFNVGGWYDIFNAGNVKDFTYLQNEGAAGARGNQKLYMGPFAHGDLDGDLAYPGFDSMFGAAIQAEEARWWDYWLKGVDNGIMDEPPVQLYMMASARKGALSPKNRLTSFANWPSSREIRYYLTADRGLTRKLPTVSDAKIGYKYDPANPVPTVGGANLTIAKGPMDQRAIPGRQDYLRFETPVLDRDVVIAGHVSVDIWAATDGPDTDFMAKLVDVYPDGYEAVVLDAPVRALFRNGRMPDQARKMTPGAPEKMTIDLWNTALTFEKGHKIQLVITSSNSPRFEVSRNNGAPSGDKTTPARVATNTIYMDKDHPTALVLPVIYLED